MAFTKRHRNVVNPYPERYGSSERNGLTYNYQTSRNLWVLEAIHDSYINFGFFPQIGKKLELIGPINESNRFVTREDVLAYAAMYPQNCIVTPDVSAKTSSRFNPPNSDGLGLVLKRISSTESYSQLLSIATTLKERNELDRFVSKSTPEAQHPDNQVPEESGEMSIQSQAEMLIDIPFITSSTRLSKIRQSMGFDVDNIISPVSPVESILPKNKQSSVPIVPQGINFNFYDWAANVPPESEKKTATYFNTNDKKYYFCMRTNSRIPEDYRYEVQNVNERVYNNPDKIAKFKERALSSLLIHVGAKTTKLSNKQDFLDRLEVQTKYGDSNRPLPPALRGVWLLSATISKPDFLEFVDIGEEQTVVLDEEIHHYPSPVTTAKNIISNTYPVKGISKTLATFRENISKSAFLLDYYSETLTSQGISPESISGLELEVETVKLASFEGMLNNFFERYRISPEDHHGLEIKFSEDFEIEYIVYNGTLLISYIGKDINTLKKLSVFKEGTPDLEESQNIFSQLSPTSSGYLFHSPDIAAEAMITDPKQRMPWIDFLKKYTYPDINRASILPNDIFEKTNQKLGKDVEGFDRRYLHKKISQNKELTNKINQAKALAANTPGVRRISDKDLYYTVQSAIGSCPTAQAELLADVVQLYSAVTGKTSIRKILGSSISFIRKNLIRDKEHQKYLQDAERYVNDPGRIAREINEEINQELSCILDIIGDAVEDMMPLVPNRTAKQIGDLTKSSVRGGFSSMYAPTKNKLSGVTIPRMPNNNILDAYIVGIEKILEEMIKSFILGIFRDVVKAALGCGPDQKNDKPDTDKQPGRNIYSVIRINDLINEQGGIDVVQIASNIGMYNVVATNLGPSGNTYLDSLISTVPDGVELRDGANWLYSNIKFTYRDKPNGNNHLLFAPTSEQLFQFNEDVSDILTKSEALALLSGDAPESLLSTIKEMVYDGPINTEGLTKEQKDSKVFLRSIQDSYKSGDTRYATIELNSSNIVEYFGTIGSLLEGLDDIQNEEEISPEDAFCEFKNPPDVTAIDMGLSNAQLQDQINQQVNARTEQLDSLCEQYLRPMLTIENSLRDLMPAIEPPEFYTDMLKLIAAISNDIADAVRQLLADGAEQTPPPRPSQNVEDYELYIVINRVFAGQKSIGQLSLTEDGLPQWTIGDPETEGQVSFTFNNKNAKFKFVNNNLDEPINEIVAVSELSDDNADCEDGTYSLKNMTDSEGKARGLPEINDQVIGIINTALSNADPAGEMMDRIIQQYGNNNTFKKVKNAKYLVQNDNANNTIPELVADFFVTRDDTFNAPMRFRKFSKAITDAKFNLLEDTCLTAAQERIAEAALEGIHARVINFYLNVGPLIRTYTGWNIPDLIEAISEYLSNEIMKDMVDKNLYGLYLNAMFHVRDGYSLAEDIKRPIRVAYDVSGIEDEELIFKYTVKQLILAALVNCVDNRVYTFAVKNALTREDYPWFSTMAKVLKSNKFVVGATEIAFPGEGGMDAAFPDIAAVTDPTWENNYVMYYLPIPLIWAMNIMFFDKSVRLNQRHSQFRFYTGQRVAAADDNFLSAINDAHISIFSSKYAGYPVVVGENTYYSEEELLERLEFLKQQRTRIKELEFVFGGLALTTKDNNSYRTNNAYITTEDTAPGNTNLGTKNIDHYKDYFNPLYQLALPRMRSLYDTPEKMRTLQEIALAYNFVGRGNNAAQWPNNDNGSLNSYEKRAWYERMRLIGQAPSGPGTTESQSFIWRYFNGEDLTNRFGSDAETEIGQDTNGNKVTLRGFLQACRKYAINEQAFVGDEDTRSSMQEVIAGVLTPIIISAIMASGVAVVSILFTAIATASISFGAVGAWMAAAFVSGPGAPFVLVGLALTVAVGWVWAALDDYDWEDPNSNNSIARFSNDYEPITLMQDILPDGFPSSEKSQRPLDLPADMVSAAPHLSGHGNTLEKVAAAQLYYELATKSTSIKPLIDKENPNNEIDFIIDFLGLPEEEETVYPVYLTLECEVPPLNSKVFYSEEELRTEVRRLKNKVVFRNKEYVNSRRTAIRDIQSRLNQLIADAEELTGDDNFETFRGIRQNATEFVNNYMDTEANDAWYISARTNLNTDVLALAATALTLIVFNEPAENKVKLGRNIVIGGGANRSIVGYINELQAKYDDISDALPYGRRLHDDENFQTQLAKIERDIALIDREVATAIGEEAALEAARAEKSKIYGSRIC